MSTQSSLTPEERAGRLLRAWGESLLSLQIREPIHSLQGALLCPACARVHGRCGDAIYPFMHLARSTGEERWVRAAEDLFNWAEARVSPGDGSWMNDLESGWWGTTVFGAIALGQALRYHNDLLPSATGAVWLKRLEAAVGFINRSFTLNTGNINYPASAPAALALGAQLCKRPEWLPRAQELAHAVLDRYVSPQGFIWGEGSRKGPSPRGVFAVDLGYNIDESLPNLALYAELTGDIRVLAAVADGYRMHLSFLLPDGGWDAGWSTRQFKWMWWGSRTSDGCLPGLVLMARRDPTCAAAVGTVLGGLENATHDGLLHPGYHHARRGMHACAHHTMCYAKGLAFLLDQPMPLPPHAAPPPVKDDARSYPDLGVTLLRQGPWRASFSVSDIGYNDHPTGAVRTLYPPCGGSCTLLWHDALGPLLSSSMIDYQLREPYNMEPAHREQDRYPLTPEAVMQRGTSSWRSVRDTQATLTVDHDGAGVITRARLLDEELRDPPEGAVLVISHWRFTREAATLEVELQGPAGVEAELSVPLIVSGDTPVTATKTGARITIAGKSVELSAEPPDSSKMPLIDRVYNHVPGFEAIPWRCVVRPGRPVRLNLTVN